METDVCGYCGRAFAANELAIEKEIHGRLWKFCSEECYNEFMDAIHFRDEPEIVDGEVKVSDDDVAPGPGAH